MIKLNLTELQTQEIAEALDDPRTTDRAKTKLLAIRMHSLGMPHGKIAAALNISDDTVTNSVKSFRKGGVAQLIENRHFRMNQISSKSTPFILKKSPAIIVMCNSCMSAACWAAILKQLALLADNYASSTPRLASWMEHNLLEGFTVFAFPEPIRKRLRTSNLCESLSKAIRRRIRVAAIFPNEASCLRLVSAILMEISDDWESSQAYLNPQLLY